MEDNRINVTVEGDDYLVTGNFTGTLAELCALIEAQQKQN